MFNAVYISAVAIMLIPPPLREQIVVSTMENRCYFEHLQDPELSLYRADHHLRHCRGFETPTQLNGDTAGHDAAISRSRQQQALREARLP